MSLWRSLLCSTVLFSFASQAFAQGLPETIDPGRVQQRFERDQRPAIVPDEAVPGAQQEQAPSFDPALRFELKSVSIAGNTVFSTDQLHPLFADKIGTQVSLNEVQAIANAITAKYRNEGYILSRALVPVQRIGGGEVEIQVIEGYIDGVSFQGEVPGDPWLIGQYAERITHSRPLNVADMERYILLINDLAGMTARGALSPSATAQGASQLTVTLEQRDYDGSFEVDNRGSRFLGPAQGKITLRANDLAGMHERITFRTVDTLNLEELRYHELSVEQPVGPEGTRVRLLGSMTETEPGNGLEPLDIEGDSTTFILEATHPFLRSRRENLFGTFGFTYRDTESDVLGTEIYEDNIRTVHAGAAYDFYDRWLGINQVAASVTQGLDILGANDDGDAISRANAEHDFTRFNIDAQRLQSIDENFSVQLNASAQYGMDELYSSEEFTLGGEFFGSAYDPSELSGDHGVSGRAELQYNLDYPIDWMNTSQFYTFLDGGKIWNRNALAGEFSNASLVSSGLGMRFNALDQWRGGLELALPMTRDVSAEGSDGDDARIFFRLSYDLP
jgi:hemolysin activation/secretion protein